MTTTSVKTRFAPSPTGLLHAGNLRTALFNALMAWRHDGTFLLRIEDSDTERTDPHALEAIQADLHWLGLHWDEGPGAASPPAQWQQSARAADYSRAVAGLLETGAAYPCFCSAERLAALRDQQRAAGAPIRYDGCCARIDAADARQRQAAGEPAVIRLRLPDGDTVAFEDLVRGHQSFALDALGDPVVQRADGRVSFLLANAIDDALMGVTHVLRGEDHLSNTPRQLVLLNALDLPTPQYGHVGLVVEDDGAPLSKRTGAPGVGELRRAGYLPEAVVNYLARLGNSGPGDGLETLDTLAARFEPERLGRGPARYDAAQLDHWQAEAMATLPEARLLEAVEPAWVPAEKRADFVRLVRANLKTLGDLQDWAERLCAPAPAFTEAATAAVTGADPEFFRAAIQTLETADDMDWAVLRPALESATGCRGGQLMKPLRFALTGLGYGPGLGDVIAFMPADIRRTRLNKAAEQAAGAQPNA
ncbi:glutamate--tRNA ligase [Spiribacter salinus]|jgi:glutamyl-tRNA synthetase|uniref:glutamate--tRNA ligase n=1 Tax=Spiribacter salinus TaxID=1335746 RepID=UPI001C94DD2E|nr:glutamate--tRNA ligase [Spiribacter salinus]